VSHPFPHYILLPPSRYFGSNPSLFLSMYLTTHISRHTYLPLFWSSLEFHSFCFFPCHPRPLDMSYFYNMVLRTIFLSGFVTTKCQIINGLVSQGNKGMHEDL
jgi:hypothetical protein